LNFTSLERLFDRDEKRNKAAFQTLFYSFLYGKVGKVTGPVQPGLYNRKNIFGDEFLFGLQMNKEAVPDATGLWPPFAEQLSQTVHQLYDPGQPFTQTTHEKHCEFCAYKALCRR
jgi:hypothetical protein